MGKNSPISYRDRLIWALDAVVGIFAKFAIDVACERPEHGTLAWFDKMVDNWRVRGTYPCEFGFGIADDFDDEQVRIVIEVFNEACRRIDARGEISAEEVESWALLEGEPLFARGIELFKADWITQLGRAMIGMFNGTLPYPRAEHAWGYYAQDEPILIRMQGSGLN